MIKNSFEKRIEESKKIHQSLLEQKTKLKSEDLAESRDKR